MQVKALSTMTKDEIRAELEAHGEEYSSKDLKAELMEQLKLVRLKKGCKTAGQIKKENAQKRGNLTSLTRKELLQRCKEEGISVTEHVTMSEMIRRLKATYVLQDGPTDETVLKIGKHKGLTFLEIYDKHPHLGHRDSGGARCSTSPGAEAVLQLHQNEDGVGSSRAERRKIKFQLQRRRKHSDRPHDGSDQKADSGEVLDGFGRGEGGGYSSSDCASTDYRSEAKAYELQGKVVSHDSAEGKDTLQERRLAAKVAKELHSEKLNSKDYQHLANFGRYAFVEVCCSPQSVLTSVCTQLGGKAYRINLANGYDLTTSKGIDAAKAWVKQNRPKEAWISLPCTPWSPMQNLTPLTPEREFTLRKQRKEARRMIRKAIDLVKFMIECDCNPCWEWPLRATSWGLDEVVNQLLKLLPFKSRPDGCAFGMKAVDVNELVLKSWRVQCRTEEQANRINIQCQGNHTHVPIEGSVGQTPQHITRKH